uniref:Uncharacterized protein n=1 Tax=Solanum tuberosum TaxID=4113 RepID=M1CWV0_SOLTU
MSVFLNFDDKGNECIFWSTWSERTNTTSKGVKGPVWKVKETEQGMVHIAQHNDSIPLFFRYMDDFWILNHNFF